VERLEELKLIQYDLHLGVSRYDHLSTSYKTEAKGKEYPSDHVKG